MDQVLERVAGLDVHKKTVTVCVRVPGPRGGRRQEVRTFGTTVPELLALREWLETQGVTHAAMESTGVYWKPVFYILEESVTCILANAAHIARVPGRKTDVQDCVWIAQLVEHGLVRGSFVPPAPIRDLRDLTRARKALSQDRTRAANRLHKVLEDAGIKLASVANDVLGVSGRAMLEALVGGTTDPTVLADLARGKLRAKLPALRHALAGRFRPHHAFLVGQLLAQLDFLEEAMAQVSAQIDEVITPFQAELERLDAIPGVNRRTAGKHKVSPTRRGDRWLRTALVEAALSASRATDSALAARYRRVMRHRGHKKAVIAVAHAILISAYHVLARQIPYRDLGPDYYDHRHAERVRRRAIAALERQGYRVSLEPAA